MSVDPLETVARRLWVLGGETAAGVRGLNVDEAAHNLGLKPTQVEKAKRGLELALEDAKDVPDFARRLLEAIDIGVGLVTQGGGTLVAPGSLAPPIGGLSEQSGRIWSATEQPLPRRKRRAFERRWGKLDSEGSELLWRRWIRERHGLKGERRELFRAYVTDFNDFSETIRVHDSETRELRKKQRCWERACEMIHAWIDVGEPITLERIIDLHDRIVAAEEGSEDARRSFRAHEVSLGPSTNLSTLPRDIEPAMRALLKWHETAKKELHPVELAARFYQKFLSIHPFADGNGRTGKALLDWILQANGMPPAVFTSPAYAMVAVTARRSAANGLETDGDPERAIEAVTLALENAFQLAGEYGI